MSKKLTLNIINTRSNNKNLDSIKTLNLWGCKLSDISILKQLPALETISLSENQIKDISVLKTLKNLRELYLKGNQISDWDQINNLKDCKKLEKLVLKGNPISNNSEYPKKVIEILPQLVKLDDKEIKEIKSMKNEINDNISQKNGNNNNKQINNSTTFSNLNPEYTLNDTKNDMKENFAAPVIGSHYIGHKMKNKNENGSKNINNNLGIIDPLVGDPKISEKTLEVFNKSFKKKKTERTFFKLGKNHLNEKGNNIYQENDISINEKENNNSLTNTRYEDNDRYKTLSTSFSLRMYKNIIDPNIKIDGYKKKIIKGYKNSNSKLNQSTYLKYKQFDNEEEEEKRKENSNEKIMNKSFYHTYNKNILTYSKKTLDSKENSF